MNPSAATRMRDATPPAVTAGLVVAFGLAIGALGAWRPGALLSGAGFLAAGWLVSMALKPGARLRRWRTLVLIGFVAAPAALAATGASRWAAAAIVVAACSLLGLVSALHARFARGLQEAWMEAAEPVGWSVSVAVLTITFVLVVVPIGLVLRLTGHDPLRRRADPGGTCWVPLDKGTTPKSCFRQF